METGIRAQIIAKQQGFHAKKVDYFFKYLSDDPRVMKGIFEDHVIRFTQPRGLNDPLEFSPSIRFKDPSNAYHDYEFNGIPLPSVESFWRVQIVESQINDYGILSLTKIPDSFDMWSQYSNGHKGFIIHFKPDFNQYPGMKSRDGQIYPVEQVNYVDDYHINLDDLADKTGFLPIDVLKRELFYKKTLRWQHEQEYRMVRPFSDHPKYSPPTTHYAYTDPKVYLFPFDPGCIASIIVGASTSRENKLIIMKFAEEHNLTLAQVHIFRDVPDWMGRPSTISILPVDEEHKSVFLTSQPQLFCTDTACIDNRGNVKIRSLTDLPYYRGHEAIVRTVYNAMKEYVKAEKSE